MAKVIRDGSWFRTLGGDDFWFLIVVKVDLRCIIIKNDKRQKGKTNRKGIYPKKKKIARFFSSRKKMRMKLPTKGFWYNGI